MRTPTIEKTELRSEYYVVECDLSPIDIGTVRVVLRVPEDEPLFTEGDAVADALRQTSDRELTQRIADAEIAPVLERCVIAWDWPDNTPCAGQKKSDFIALCGVPLWNAARGLVHGETTESVTRRHAALRSLVKSIKPVAGWSGMY